MTNTQPEKLREEVEKCDHCFPLRHDYDEGHWTYVEIKKARAKLLASNLATREAVKREIHLERLIGVLELAKCHEPFCDNKGTIANRISEDEWEPQQCQWCDERTLALSEIKAFINSLN